MRRQRKFQPSIRSSEHRLAPSSAMVVVTASAAATVGVNQDGNFDGQHGDQTGADVPTGGETGGTARAPADLEGEF
jgi:hypothetical protein